MNASGSESSLPVPVIIGFASSRESGWSYPLAGRAIFAPDGLHVLYFGGAYSWLGVYVVNRMREGRTLVVDTSSGIAVWDDERGTAKMDLGDGRWLVLTVIMTSWVPSKAARTERAEDRARLLSGLREAYGARLEHAQVENPRASMAGKILLFCFLMALALAILAILGFSGMLD